MLVEIIAFTYREPDCPNIHFTIPLHVQNDLRGPVKPWHDITLVSVTNAGFTKVAENR